MELRLVPVGSENREALLQLSPGEGKESFIESVAECLEEAAENPCWRPVGLYVGEEPVGFAMYCRWQNPPGAAPWEGPEKPGRVWLDRLLIDHRFQGQGWGKKAMEVLVPHLRQEYGPVPLYLSVYPENKAAFHLYQAFGFQENGELDLKGERVMVAMP